MGREDRPGLDNCFGVSGWLKIFQSSTVFICLMIHRIGKGGGQAREIVL